jgi:hypothetical protein
VNGLHGVRKLFPVIRFTCFDRLMLRQAQHEGSIFAINADATRRSNWSRQEISLSPSEGERVG